MNLCMGGGPVWLGQPGGGAIGGWPASPTLSWGGGADGGQGWPVGGAVGGWSASPSPDRAG